MENSKEQYVAPQFEEVTVEAEEILCSSAPVEVGVSLQSMGEWQ